LAVAIAGAAAAILAELAWLAQGQTPASDFTVGSMPFGHWLWDPIERNRFLRVPSADSSLSGVAFSRDGRRGWAVGMAGTILNTRDGGGSWQLQSSGTERWLQGVTFQSDSQRGRAVGMAGTILSTRDGGSSWQPQSSGVTSGFYGVTFTSDGQRGWAVGSDGTILHTRDGGNSWQPQSSGVRSDLYGVTFTNDGQCGWAVGAAGTILSTRNGGNSWQAQSSDTESGLLAVTFASEGQRGWAVGVGGAILSTRDGGSFWRPQSSGTETWLQDITFQPDGQRGWAVGMGGTILSTRDGGNTWQPQSSGTSSGFHAVTFTSDGQRGWVVGSGGTILSTRDGGGSWVAATYARYPAPWFYLAAFLVLAAAVAAGLRFNRRTVERVLSIEDKGESDEPIASAEQDRLGFAGLAQGMARYLRNAATKPPLTIALNAPWGRGKSSVMRILDRELKQAGVKTVWFNAWHHQKEQVMLAGLLASIGDHALPGWLSWLGIRFRSRLLRRRLRRRPWCWLACGAVLLLPLWHVVASLGRLTSWLAAGDRTGRALEGFAEFWQEAMEHESLQNLFDGNVGAFFSVLASRLLAKPEHLLDLLAALMYLGGLLALLLYGLRAFPDSPNVLLASLSSRFKRSELEAQTAFRRRFSFHFSDVCEALRPRTLVIFLDDLDRCEPAKTAEMLEAVNYLVHSGPCFVVLGMAREAVEAQLVYHYRDLADVFSKLKQVETAARPSATASEDHARVEYVRDYLRKLVNLEVYVPALTGDQVGSLLGIGGEASPSDESSHRWRLRAFRAAESAAKWWEHGGRGVAGWTLLVALLACGLFWFSAGLERWNQSRLATLQQGRAAATTSRELLREAERRAVVALDYAKGREQAAAVSVFERWGIPLAGLKFDLPLERKPAPATAVDPCADQPELAAAAGTAARPTRPEPAGGAERAIRCWQERARASRAAEVEVATVRTLSGTAENARSRDNFHRLDAAVAGALEAAHRAEIAAGLDLVRKGPPPPPSPPGTPDRPAREERSSPKGGDGSVVKWHAPAPSWLSWFPGLALLVLIVVGMRIARDHYVIHDDERFEKALRIWSTVIAADPELAAPREIKRFKNKARYFAMRLRSLPPRRGWLRHLLLPDQPGQVAESARTKLDEPLMVALTAIHHVRPDLLRDGRLLKLGVLPELRTSPVLQEVAKAIEVHGGKDGFGRWPAAAEEIAPFLAVAGEYLTHAESLSGRANVSLPS
jgi:photosystem II stability/assembly factor-like uncharacterized protein